MISQLIWRNENMTLTNGQMNNETMDALFCRHYLRYELHWQLELAHCYRIFYLRAQRLFQLGNAGSRAVTEVGQR